jgi:hypothetical protein
VLAALLAGLTSCWLPPPAAADSTRGVAALAPRVELAVRAAALPVIDGRLDDAAWCAAPAATDLVQSRPSPGALASLPTVARVLYDDVAIYVAVRLFDPHPDSIVAPYPRRDDETTSDWIFVEIDSRLDRRSGLSFGVNPRGVQVDGSWADDVNYDAAWNGVWESAVAVDSLGWTAEYRIPFSQLPLARTGPGEPLVWGINYYRYTPHRGETSNWSPRLPSVGGIVSHFNQLRGLEVPPRSSPVEVVPYTAVTGARTPDGGAASSDLSAAAGVDLRWRPMPTTAVAASLHPDFGQVEADPSQVNLTTFETFLPEQRPLFVEGADIFQFSSALTFASRGTSFEQESPFYSRRVGRVVSGGCPAGARSCRSPASASLLGAARVSTYTARGWSGGLFHAWTGAEHATFTDAGGVRRRALAEPLTSFAVARVSRALSGGRSALGLVGTLVNRFGLEDGLDSTLARNAIVLGADGRTRTSGGGYEASGFLLASRVGGSPSAIAALRHQVRHGYDDSSHGALTGVAAQAKLARLEGTLHWTVAGRLVSRGFEANDAGFQRNANWLLAAGSWQYQAFRPGHFIRRWSVGSEQVGIGWTVGGPRRAAIVNLTAGADLRSYWGGSLSIDHEFPALDPEVLRGGPSLLRPARDGWKATAYTDSRRRWQLTLNVSGVRERATSSRALTLSPDFTAFVTDRLQLGVSAEAGSDREGWQYVDQPTDASGRVHYLLGRLRQTTAALTVRGTYAFSSHLTLQMYGQAFLSAGRYGRFKEVVAPAAGRAADRVGELGSRVRFDSVSSSYLVDAGEPTQLAFDDPAFSERDLHLNVLLRWEFLPGSTLFVAWSHQRTAPEVAPFDAGQDLARLLRAPASNALQIKATYWVGI